MNLKYSLVACLVAMTIVGCGSGGSVDASKPETQFNPKLSSTQRAAQQKHKQSAEEAPQQANN